MKVSDLMLDLATGDASMHDVYVQEAYGKINVSSAVYNATSKIAELPEGEFMILQEAADAGLPTDSEGASKMSCAAVKESINAFYDLMVASAKAVKQSCEKDLKLFTAIGKKYGVTFGGEGSFETSFAAPLAKAIFQENGGKKISLGDNKFLKGKYSDQISECYASGFSTYMVAFGVSASAIWEDPTVKSVIGGHAKNAPRTFKDVAKLMRTASKIVKFDKTVDKGRHYTSDVKPQDLVDLLIGLYVNIAISTAVIKTLDKGTKKSVIEHVNGLCSDDCADKKITKAVDLIGSNIKEWGEDVTNIVNNIKKAYSDSAYSFIETLNGGSAE
jgi:hypothetical protein